MEVPMVIVIGILGIFAIHELIIIPNKLEERYEIEREIQKAETEDKEVLIKECFEDRRSLDFETFGKTEKIDRKELERRMNNER